MFQTRLKELREAAGYKSQQAFADAFGVAQSTVGGWEAGKREPNYETTIRLANFFGVSVDYLINDEKGDLAMDERPMTFPSEGKWTKDMNEDFDNADEKTRALILTRWGYDPAHAWAAHLYFPWQFQKEQSPLQTILLQNFNQLNQEGQEKLADIADDMVSSGKYIKTDPDKLDKAKDA